MDKSTVIKKIKDLLRLSTSDNKSEAETSKNLAKKLQEKYSISDEELIDEETPFKKENLLFECKEVMPWKMALASSLADYFYCTLLQLRSQDQYSMSSYEYFLYGEKNDIEICKYWFNDLEIRINDIIYKESYKRGDMYKFSFAQGLSDGLNEMLQEVKNDLEIKKMNNEKEQLQTKEVVHVSGKEIKKPENISDTTNSKQESGQRILDPYAYYYGISIGKKLSLPNKLLDSNAEQT